MGRQIRRVPLDFKHPMGKVWTGFVNPHKYARQCPHCEGIAVNAATKELYDTFYDSNGHGSRWDYIRDRQGNAIDTIGDCRRWCDAITQDECDALYEEGRLNGNRTHDWVKKEGADHYHWVEKPGFVRPTAAEINAANAPSARGMGHDAINMWILIKARAKRLGVYGECEHCDGEGHLWDSEEDKIAYESWKDYGPPEGEGWQVWETVSEGSPITPVFGTPEELIDYLVDVGTSWGQKYSRQAATAFVTSERGWVPSAMIVPGVGLVSNIDGAPYLGK
jgi:hypothetical protein